MRNVTVEELESQYKKLPSKLKAVAFSPSLQQTIIEIGKLHKLHIDQIELLRNVTKMTVVGLISAQEFSQEVSRLLKIDEQKAQDIAKDIDEQVFESIRQAMKDFAAGKLTAETERAQQEMVAPQEDLGDVLENRKQELEGVSQVRVNKQEVAKSQVPPTTQSASTTVEPAPLQDSRATAPPKQLEPREGDSPLTPSKQERKARTPGKTLYQGDDPYREPVDK